jgi:hypothetical protein
MSRFVIIALPFFCALGATAQNVNQAPRKVPGTEKPACSPGAICFSGEVSKGKEFRRTINADFDFVLGDGWTIAIVPTRPEGNCKEFASVVNPPYRAHNDLYINTSYGWTAEDEVSTSPRGFSFVTNCAAYRIEYERLLIALGSTHVTPKEYEEALGKLGTSPTGRGRLWITDSRTSHAHDTPDDNLGSVEYFKFSVEIVLPRDGK